MPTSEKESEGKGRLPPPPLFGKAGRAPCCHCAGSRQKVQRKKRKRRNVRVGRSVFFSPTAQRKSRMSLHRDIGNLLAKRARFWVTTVQADSARTLFDYSASIPRRYFNARGKV